MRRSLCNKRRFFKKYNDQGNPLVCKLNKNLYGLKQSGRNWYLTIKGFLGGLGFVPSIQDECLFTKNDKGDIEGMICLWVDDMVILGTQQHFCEKFKNKVSWKFKISNFGDLSWFLNIKTDRKKDRIILSQEAYTEKLIGSNISVRNISKTSLALSQNLSEREASLTYSVDKSHNS